MIETASSIETGTGISSRWWISKTAIRRIPRSSGAIRWIVQPWELARDLGVDLGEIRVGALGEVAGERLGALEQILEGLAGHVALVEREGGVAALI